MGATMSKAYVEKYKASKLHSGRKGILFVGLDGAGKSTIMYRLILGKHIHTIPTMGHNKEHLDFEGHSFDLFDVGGSALVREAWDIYAKAADAVVFVVDSTDEARMHEAKGALKKLFEGHHHDSHHYRHHDGGYNIPVLIFANKQDLPGALPADKIEKLLDVGSLSVKATMVVPCEAINGENIQAGLFWIVEQFKHCKTAGVSEHTMHGP